MKAIRQLIQKSEKSSNRSLESLRHLMFLFLLCGSIGAWAADYVFISNETNGYFLNSSAQATQTFSVETCVWSCINTGNNNAASLGGTSRRLHIGNTYLRGRNNNNANSARTGGANDNYVGQWRAVNNYLVHYNSANRYVYNNNGTPYWNNSTDRPDKAFGVYSYTKTDENFTVADITGVNDALTATGTFNLSSAASYTPEYYKFTGPDTRYYASGYTTGAVTTAISAKTSGFTTDTWAITPVTSGITINNSGRLSYTTQVTNDTQITITHTVTENGKTKSTEKTITLYSANIATPTITRSGNSVTLATTSIGATIHYTTDGSTPTTSSPQYTSAIDLSSMAMPVTIKAIAVRNSNSSDVTYATYSQLAAPSPMISISSGTVTITAEDGFTIYYTTNGDNPTVGASGTSQYTGTFNVTNQTTVKAIAVKTGYDNSAVVSAEYVVSGVSGGTVILNDYEDHNWAYYKGRDIKVGTASDAPNYKDKYKYTLYSPDPRNVKITYRGFNTDGKTIYLGGSDPVATSTLNTTPSVSNVEGEGQNTFVFYKTLEKFVIGYFTDSKDWNGIPDDPTKENYPYTVISNPFSVRPSTGSGDSKKYYGFAGWKIISGGKYIGRGSEGTYTAASNGDVLDLDELIHFVNLDADVAYTPNCTSAEVVLEATWTEATVWSGNTAHDFGTTGTYETNFIVASGNIASIEQGTPCTIIGMNPDGTGDNSGSRTITGLKVTTTSTTKPYDRSNCVKVEWIRHGDGTFDANGRNMTMGRGIISSSGSGNTAQGNVYGNNTQNQNVVNTVKVESGYYSGIANINNKAAYSTNEINSYMILGCDYDRALANYYVPASEINNNAYNIKLRASRIYGPNGQPNLQRANGQLYMRSLFKSGVFASEIGNEYYFHTYQRPGQRYIEMEGGYNKGHVKGGSDGSTSQGRVRAMSIRMKGGRIDGQLACGSTSTFCSGDRLVVITGGRIGGWLAPGSNCSGEGSATGTTGTTDGTSYVYFGGTAEINSHQFGSTPSMIYQSTGGVIYGAGLGYRTTDRTGEMTLGSNIVFADDAYCERGIYGGGAIGQTLTTANIFILGGRVGTGTGQIIDQGTDQTYNNVKAGVYGGACNRGGENSFIYMDGGIVESGIYGGANISGTMTGNVTMQINGGQVGYAETEANANVHGGGYGQPTRVTGNVDVTIGKLNAESGATIYGDVYGGSALGYVNGTAASTTKHTNVTLNAGTINGSLYGGGLGDNTNAANVYGPVQVTVNGGSVFDGAVYGCNNVNGAPQMAVSVIVNGTDSHNDNGTAKDFTDDTYAINAVYGGGNRAAYTYGVPTVTVNNCDNSIKYVYGGGNQATVPSTNVTIHGGNVIGNVFGGGNNADVTGLNIVDENKGTRVNIDGGRILNVYGGNNNGGAITGTIKVSVAESTDGCGVNIDDLYGGGNKAASNAGQITIGKCTKINRVFGGANQADVTGPINLNIVDGNIGTVFGGNNNSGTITGAITVNVNWNGTGNRSLGNVYGGGNLAEYTGSPTVNIINAKTKGSVFGGGLGKSAVVVGNPTVNIGDWINGHSVIIGGDVFGGGDLAAVEGNPTVTIRDCGTLINGDLYGGGNAAPVYSTNTTMWGGTVKGNVFGGGNGADPTKNENGAQVGYDRNENKVAPTSAITGNATLNVFGGTIGTWNGDECTSGGGIFGGSNTKGNIAGEVNLTLDAQKCTESGATKCTLKIKEVYGSGNEAAYAGTGINFNLGCVSALSEIYGGAKNADMNGDIHLIISSGHFNRVFGGNNLGGRINGSIKVTIDETGCEPVIIDELYGCGNNAAYSVYGYNEDGTVKTSGTNPEPDPEVNIISFTHIGKVFGGGYGAGAVVAGNPTVNINVIPGEHAADDDGTYLDEHKLGSIGTVFGGGNAANVVGNTSVNIGTVATNAHIAKKGDSDIDTSPKAVGANITGNVYGGGNAADVTGKTNVVVGQPKTTPVTP